MSLSTCRVEEATRSVLTVILLSKEKDFPALFQASLFCFPSLFVLYKRDIFSNLPLTRAHVNRLRSLLMAISFHLQSLLENH